jgi:tRNA A37 methylthiotransferase MiaB
LRKIKGHKNIEKIVLGGPTIVGGLEAMQNEYPQADLFIESYGEKVFANMRKYFSENNKYVIDLPDFSTLQSPYLSGRVVVSKGMTVRMELRRGCCFQCTYCRYKDNTRKIYCIGNTDRWKREVMLFKNAKVKKINVLDAFFDEQGKNKKLGLDFLKYCKQVGLEAEISLQIRPECLDDDYLEIVSQMPNVILEIGIQSLDEKVMKAIKRGNREKVLKTLGRVAELGVRTEITMIYGLPHQTAQSFENDLCYLDGLGFETISAFQLSIYNGTEMGKTYKDYGLIVKRDSVGVLKVYDNPTHDIDLMKEIYRVFKERKMRKAA